MPDLPVLDPLDALRVAGDPEIDVYLTGTVFLDIIFTGLDSAPVRGTESWARGMGSSPGGIANMATALARLGLRTSLAAAFGDDMYGDFCWECLDHDEGIDLSLSRRVRGWHSPVTVSMAYEDERTMVSHGHEAPPPEEPAPQLPADAPAPPSPRSPRAAATSGSRHAARHGSRIFADVGWDDIGRWDLADLADLAALRGLPAQRRGGHALHPYRLPAPGRPPARRPGAGRRGDAGLRGRVRGGLRQR